MFETDLVAKVVTIKTVTIGYLKKLKLHKQKRYNLKFEGKKTLFTWYIATAATNRELTLALYIT